MNRVIDRGVIKVEFIPPTKWWKRATWKLLESYASGNGNVVAKVGFISDGASIPPGLTWLFSPTGRYFGAAIVHDYIIDNFDDWERANREFEQEIIYLGCPKWERVILVAAVEFWAWLKRVLKQMGVL
jgi:hypothetical protein